jgi:hypothetical protein
VDDVGVYVCVYLISKDVAAIVGNDSE